MAIQVGEKLPSVNLRFMEGGEVKTISSEELFAGKKSLMFALPGAFTATCSAKHLPGYVAHSDEFSSRGIDQIICLSVNDANVMEAWGNQHGAEGKVLMVADGNAEFTLAVGLEVDLKVAGMGLRSQRYAMIVNDGIVELLNLEAPREYKVSDADTLLASL
jgi:peroxiredoxin